MQIIHDFADDEGSNSSQGVAIDRAGNLFGATATAATMATLAWLMSCRRRGKAGCLTSVQLWGP